MATYEDSVQAALNEGHVYVHYPTEKSPKPSELGMTDLLLLVKKLKPKEIRETIKGHTQSQDSLELGSTSFPIKCS